ncbi:MAG TPA: MlaD family protein [Myxococcaceae bacterium]|nr:MlaD family protein [Myxococcaceae bacterium]
MSNGSVSKKERRFVIRTGIFVSVALALAGVVIFLIGKENRLFDRQHLYYTAFTDVDGLKLDSPVRLGGLDVGVVSSITFSTDLNDQRIRVELQISGVFADRIRADSVAQLASRGVLGDKAIDISLGSASQAQVANGGELTSRTSGDITALLESSGEIVENAVALSRDLRRAVQDYTDPQVQKDVVGAINAVGALARDVRAGGGVVQMLLTDKRAAQDMREALAGASKASVRFDGAMAEAESILQAVRTGEGAVHAMLYDKRTGKAFSELGDAAAELAGILHDAKKTPGSAVNQLVYGDSKNLIRDLGDVAADLKKISGKVASGQGSLGLLINDPTVYEDLKTVLGNVKRNRVLRALVRYSISNSSEIQEAGEVKGEEAAKGAK